MREKVDRIFQYVFSVSLFVFIAMPALGIISFICEKISGSPLSFLYGYKDSIALISFALCVLTAFLSNQAEKLFKPRK